MSEVTRILGSIAQGDPKAAEELLPLFYAGLRGREGPGECESGSVIPPCRDAQFRLRDCRVLCPVGELVRAANAVDSRSGGVRKDR